MRIVLVEDEQPAREKVKSYLLDYHKKTEVTAELENLENGRIWFKDNKAPDLVILDIQLADGNGFQLLKEGYIKCPVIFITAYDEFILESLNYHSIDYLLKPVKREKLYQALDKLAEISTYYKSKYVQLFETLGERKNYKERIIAKKGNHSVVIQTSDISYFFTEHKITFLVSNEGKKYVLDDPLSTLENKLSPDDFFRLNRKYLVHIDAVLQFQSYGKGRIIVTLQNQPAEDVLVSQENAHNFRNWVDR